MIEPDPIQADHMLDGIERGMRHSGWFESENKTDKANSFVEKVQELRRIISRYRIEIQNMNRRGENTTALEAQLNEIEQSLNNAQTSDDLDSVKQQLEAFGNHLNSHDDSNQVGGETENHSGDQGKTGKGDDFEEPEPPEEPEIPKETNSTV